MNIPYMISVKDLERPYSSRSDKTNYLRSLSFNIATGEIFGVIGRSDSGKSALLRTLTLLDKPNNGIISIDNHNLTIMSGNDLKHIQKRIALLTHSFGLLSSKSVYDNIALPLIINNHPKNEIMTSVTQMLTLISMADKSNTQASDLNSFEKLKVAIARMLILKPKVVLLDDITRALDPKASQLIINLIKDLHAQLKFTAIVVTNDFEAIKELCGRVGIMHKGEMIEITSTLELFNEPKSDVAKDFIKANTKHELPLSYRRKLTNVPEHDSHPIIRFCFTGCLVPEVHLSQVISNYDLKISILQGHQETINSERVNILIAEVEGRTDSILEACAYLQNHDLNSEIIGYVKNTSRINA